MKKFFKRFLPVLLVFALAFGSVAPVQAAVGFGCDADDAELKYWYELVFEPSPSWNVGYYDNMLLQVESDKPVVFYENTDGCVYFMYTDDCQARAVCISVENGVGGAQYGSAEYSEYDKYYKRKVGPSIWATQYSLLKTYTDNVLVFSSYDTAVLYIDTGDLQGLLNTDVLVGPSLPDDAPEQSVDDILNDVWWSVADEEVVYEEDDGTTLGAIRASFKNIVNGIISPIKTVQKYIKLLPSALLGVWTNSSLGKWIKGLYETALAIPGAILDAFLQSDFVKWIEGLYSTALAIPGAILDAFLQSDFVTWIKGIYTAALGIPVAIVNNITDKLEYWFVPSVDDWKRHFKNYDAFCSEKLGLLYYPYDVFRDLMAAYIAVDSNSKLTVPGYSMSIGGNVYTIWESLEVDMDQLDVFKYVRMFTSFLQACGLWKLAGDKWEDWIAEGRH